MKHKLGNFGLCILAIALTLSVGVTQAGSDGIVALATGSGQIHTGSPPQLRTFSFTAQTDSLGITRGQFELHNRASDLRVHGVINCLNVAGNVATMSGTATNVNPATPPFFVDGSPILFQVVDNGNGPNQSPDLISLVFFFGTPPGDPCTDPTLGVFANIPIEHGNVTVH